MILYTLTNASLKMEVFEDKVTFTPRTWKSMTSKHWAQPVTISYHDLQQVTLDRKYWPMGHCLTFVSQEKEIVFKFRKIYPFFERLKIYLERQMIRYYNKPHLEQVTKPQTVLEIVEERKKKKTPSSSSPAARLAA
jgi:hypothetical protein